MRVELIVSHPGQGRFQDFLNEVAQGGTKNQSGGAQGKSENSLRNKYCVENWSKIHSAVQSSCATPLDTPLPWSKIYITLLLKICEDILFTGRLQLDLCVMHRSVHMAELTPLPVARGSHWCRFARSRTSHFLITLCRIWSWTSWRQDFANRS